MPNRDYYLLEGAKYDAYRAAYQAYLTKLQQLAGIADAAARADGSSRSKPRSPRSTGSPRTAATSARSTTRWTAAKLNAFAPQLQWDRALPKAGLGDVKTVVVTEDHRGPGDRQAGRQRAARDLEGLSRLPLHQRPRRLSAQGFRPGPVRLSIRRRCATFPPARPLETRRRPGQRRARRGRRPDLRPAPLSAGSQPADGRADRQFPRRPEGKDRDQRLDGRGDQEGGAGQARDLRSAHRPPGQIYRLFDAPGRSRRPARQRHALRAVRLEPAARG